MTLILEIKNGESCDQVIRDISDNDLSLSKADFKKEVIDRMYSMLLSMNMIPFTNPEKTALEQAREYFNGKA